MAFLAGAAFAGIVAFVLLRTGTTPGQYNNLPNYSPNYSVVPPPPDQSSYNSTQLPLPPSSTSQDMSYYYGRQQSDTQRLKEQLEQQRSETEQVKAQLKSQQMIIDVLTAQVKTNAVTPQPTPTQALAPAQQQQPEQNPVLTGALWAAGGMVLTLFGGLLLAGMFALLSQQQRPPRTVQVIHPISSPPSPLPVYRSRSEFLPPRLEGRRIDSVDYDR